MKKTLFVFYLLCLSIFLTAQQKFVVKGKVTDADNIGIPGVSVLIKGSAHGTITDLNGDYNLEISPEAIMVFSYIGFISQEVAVNNQEVINIVLQESTEFVDEVVVIGYGTTNKIDKTGSISSFSSEDILQQPVLTATQSIQGKTSGIQVISSGQPGSTPTIRIRGLGTVLGGRDPLYVVDGLITDRIDNINSADIHSMDILKDASSLAIYGNRGANGVVIITTKKGKSEKLSVTYNANYGFKEVNKKVKMANASEFVAYSNDAFIATYPNGRFGTPEYDTDWFDEITQQGTFMNHSLSLSGSTDKVNYYFSVGYYDEKGILKGNDFNRVTLRSNVEYNITDNLKFGHRVGLAISDENQKPFSVFTEAYRQSSLVPVRYDNGKYGLPIDEFGAYNNLGNPIATLDFHHQNEKDYSLQGAITGEYKFTDFLKFNTSFTIETAFNRNHNYIPNREQWLAADTSRQVSAYDPASPINTLEIARDNKYRWTLDNYFTFSQNFADVHQITATLGTSAERGRLQYRNFQRGINVPENSNFWNLGNAESITTIPADAHDVDPELNLISFFGRAYYSYDSKYMLTATIRADGSGQFQKDSRWGYFPSIGVGWVLSEESFLSNSSIINFLKLRGSWGQLGNQNIPLNILTVNTGLEYPFGNGQVVQPGTTVTEGLDPNVSWEKTSEFDIGLEFTLLNNRLSGEIDYYDRLNENALLNVAAPDILGLSNTPVTHAAKIRNKGFEAELRWSANINEFNYYIGGNITFNQNELEEITNEFAVAQQGGSIGNGQVTKRLEEGEPLGSFWLYEVESVSATGEFVYKDNNGDGNVDDEDRKYMGSYQPKLYYGFSMGFTFKNWDFSLDSYGNYGNKVYNGKKAQRWGGENVESSVVVDRWTTSNLSTTEPAPFNAVPVSSDYYLESGSFFRINNITLGYSLKNTIKFIDLLRVYVSAQNPIIIQEFSGFTPELQGDGNPLGSEGIELNAYPTLRSYLIGLSINF